MTLADRLVVLNAGQVEQIGAPIEVYRRPASAFVAAFIGSPAMNLLSAQHEGRMLHLGGAELPTPVDGRGPVTLGIRPEDFARATPGSTGAVPVRVEYVEELGATRLIHGRVKGQALVALWPAGAEVPDEVWLSAPAAALHMFHHETGRRLN
jgi:sn-glycerol 3-phosphate transport system ATP-binding protein